MAFKKPKFPSNGLKRHKLPYTLENKVEALTNPWVFADLIRFQGDDEFGEIHQELVNFIAAAQINQKAHLKAFRDMERLKAKFPPVYLKQRFRLVLMPRGHLKSTIGSILYALWRVYRNPSIRIIYSTNERGLAKKFIRLVKQYLENPTLQDYLWNDRPHYDGPLVPKMDQGFRKRRDIMDTEANDKKVIWTSEALQVVRPMMSADPTIQAVSVGSTGTGSHVDLVINDDIVDKKNSRTKDTLQNVFDHMGDLEFILDPMREVRCGDEDNPYAFKEVIGKEKQFLGTRYAKGDPYEKIIDGQEKMCFSTFIHNIYKNGTDNKDGYLWEPRFNDLEISTRREECTPSFFASQYLNKIIAEADKALHWEHVRWFTTARTKIMGVAGFVKFLDEGQEDEPIGKGVLTQPICVVDPALGTSNGDYTAIAVGAKLPDGTVVIYDMVVDKIGPQKTIDAIYKLKDRWKFNVTHIECVAYQAALLHRIKQEIREGNREPLALREYRPKGDKVMRITGYLQPLAENGMLMMAHKMSNMEALKDCFDYFPSKTVHDDPVDAIAMLIELTHPAKRNKDIGQSRRKNAPYSVNSRYGGIR